MSEPTSVPDSDMCGVTNRDDGARRMSELRFMLREAAPILVVVSLFVACGFGAIAGIALIHDLLVGAL